MMSEQRLSVKCIKLPGDPCRGHNIHSEAEMLVCLKKRKKKKAITASSHIHILLVALIGICSLGANITG